MEPELEVARTQGSHIFDYLCDSLAISRVLEELGLCPPKDDKPPPTSAPRPEVARVPVDEDGRELNTL